MLKRYLLFPLILFALILAPLAQAATPQAVIEQALIPMPNGPNGTGGRNLLLPLSTSTRDLPAKSALIGTIRTRYMSLNSAALSQAQASQHLGRVISDPGIILNLFEDVVYTATNQTLAPRPSGAEGYVWNGVIDGQAISMVNLVIGPDSIDGQINLIGQAFALETVSPGVIAVSEVSGLEQHGSLQDDGIPAPLPNGNVRLAPSPYVGGFNTPQADTGDIIDVMFVYTPAAASHSGGASAMLSRIDSMVNVTNNTYAASGVNQRLRLVHSAQVSYSEYTTGQAQAEGHPTTMHASLNHATFLGGESDGFSTPDPNGRVDAIHSLRDEYRADLVVFLTLETSYDYCGLGWILSSTDMNFIQWTQRYGMNVVDIRCWSGGYTAAHELGHNMGGMHDRFNAGTGFTPVYSYAYGYQDPGQNFVTVMAYPTGGNCPPNWTNGVCSPIGRWSSPFQSYNGRPLGTNSPGTNMVQTLNNTAVVIANFRLGRLDPVILTAPANNSTITAPALTFQWEAVNLANQYTLTVSTSTGFSYSRNLTAAACAGATCSFNTNSDPNWLPPFGQLLRWSVRATETASGRNSVSASWRINTDFMPTGVTLLTPAQSGIVDTAPTFSWTHDNRITGYRLRLVDRDGQIAFSAWLEPATYCVNTTCTIALDLSNLLIPAILNTEYTWRIEARRTGVSGRLRSLVGRFTFGPRITSLAPNDGIILPNGTFNLSWAEMPNVNQYRVLIVFSTGEVVRSAWNNAEAICVSGICTIPNPATVPNASYTWRVETRDPGIAGRITSPRRTVTYGS